MPPNTHTHAPSFGPTLPRGRALCCARRADYFRMEMAMYQYEQWGLHEYKKGKGGGGGGCCEIS